ncbi:hypothetical protein [Nocardia alni]|uniref:hypothetical protein n=1 Tax=Nocardia alni TaxID=2815723 RepID=UPI001C222EB9|nr:hypothetical protein [Nocardia alni]
MATRTSSSRDFNTSANGGAEVGSYADFYILMPSLAVSAMLRLVVVLVVAVAFAALVMLIVVLMFPDPDPTTTTTTTQVSTVQTPASTPPCYPFADCAPAPIR